MKEATDNEIYLANKQGDNESIFEFIINRKIRLEKVKVEHISSYIMLVQNIMAKEKIDIIELGKYSVCSDIDDLISKYSTADVPSSETILKWFKMYYKKQSQPFKFILAKKKDTLSTLRVGVYDDY